MEKKFRYSLIGLQRVQNYQIDQLTSQLASLKDELKQNQTQVESLELQIRELEMEMIRLIQEQPAFWLESRNVTSLYIVDRRTDRQRALETQEKLIADILRLMEQVIENQKSRKLLERHKGIMHDMHRRAESKRHNALLDEHVLRKSMLDQQKRRSA